MGKLYAVQLKEPIAILYANRKKIEKNLRYCCNHMKNLLYICISKRIIKTFNILKGNNYPVISCQILIGGSNPSPSAGYFGFIVN